MTPRALSQEVHAYWQGIHLQRITISDGDGEIEIPLVLKIERTVVPNEPPSVTFDVWGRLIEHYEDPPTKASR